MSNKFQTKVLKMRGIKNKYSEINLKRPLSAGFERFNQ